MDNVGKRIVLELLKNARMPKVELAKKLNLTEAAIRKRLRKLENSGIVIGYSALVDYNKAELVASITGIDSEPERLWSLIDYLKAIEEINKVVLTSGDHMIMVEIVTDSMEKLEEVHRRIEKFEGVVRVCPAMLIRNVK